MPGLRQLRSLCPQPWKPRDNDWRTRLASPLQPGESYKPPFWVGGECNLNHTPPKGCSD